jgi:hypothetical protein
MPPVDPYEFGNATYQTVQPSISALNQKLCDTSTWYESKEAEKKAEEENIRILAGLVTQNHVPATHLISEYHFCLGSRFYSTGGFTGKFKRHFQREARRRRISGKELEEFYAGMLGLAEIGHTRAAQYGYPLSQEFLRKYGLTVPAADLKTPRQVAAEFEYQAALKSYNEGQRAIAAAFGAALAAGVTAAAAANAQPSGMYPTYSAPNIGAGAPALFDQSTDDHQGCCSWHNGIARNFLGQAQCNYQGQLMCNDSLPSPTCRCW